MADQGSPSVTQHVESVEPLSLLLHSLHRWLTGPGGSVEEHPLREREVVGSNPGRAILKALQMVPVASLLGAELYNKHWLLFSQ